MASLPLLRAPLRLLRASVFSAVCVLLTCLGHLTASGESLSGGKVAVAFAGTLGVSFALAGHERSWATILSGLLGGQFLLHSLFVSGAAHHADPSTGLVEVPGNGLGMTLAHLVAAIASAWWLRRGERHAWRLARLAARTLLRPLRALPTAPAAVEGGTCTVPSGPAEAPARTALLRHVLVLRGPPAGSRAF